MNEKNESRPMTPAELHGCVGGMGTASKLAVAGELRPRGRFLSGGLFSGAFRGSDGPRGIGAKDTPAPRVCTAAGCS